MNEDCVPDTVSERIACQQILAEDHSVYSVQRLVLPGDVGSSLTSADLLRLYFEYVERFTLGLTRVQISLSGVELRLAGLGLILFSPPGQESDAGTEKTVLRIAGGLLVQPQECDRGQLEFRVEKVPGGTRLTLQLADYCPLLLGSGRPSLLRKWLYRMTQA
jgi:hypothetical protein